MTGSFNSIQECISSLEKQGFCYYLNDNGHEIYINRKLKEIAQLNVYSDNSASALFGGISI